MHREHIQSNQQVSVQISDDKYKIDIQAGKHQLTADETEDVGGNNFGPSHYDLLLASLGSRTVMTRKMYADRKQWELGEIILHLAYKKDYAGTANNVKRLIQRLIISPGKLNCRVTSADQKARLLEIADKCPLNRVLHKEVHFSTALIDN